MSQRSIPKTVLVIDDDPMSRELIALLLEDEGYRVNSADSGEAALEVLAGEDGTPDVVLADIQLPGISGAKLAGALRRVCGSETLLLAMSGSAPPEDALSGFWGFLLKPFKTDQVAEAVATHEKELRVVGSDANPLGSGALPISPRTGKTASKEGMNFESHESEPRSAADGSADPAGCGPVLNETIYQQLAVSLSTQQLQEMYAMCVNDARQRIAGMRKLAADHDAARFMREAHAIKGGCGMLGATELHRMAAKLEVNGPDSAKAGGSQGVNSLDELSAACDRLERMLGSRM